jgi:ComF family protein
MINWSIPISKKLSMLFSHLISTKKYSLLNLVFPRRCPICDEIVVPYGNLICKNCQENLKYVKDPFCMKCGKQLKEHIEFCHDCINLQHFYNKGFALYDYQSIKSSLYRYKYKGRQEYADFYGKEIAQHLGEQIRGLHVDALIPVPLHRKKLKSRGYNQSALLANAIGKELNIPVMDKLIYRIKNTVPQKELDNHQRQNNLKKAFKISENVVKLRAIIIVDDIYTTGSTIDCISKEFIKVGIENIYFITIAIGKGL